jgi:hypothetical protein
LLFEDLVNILGVDTRVRRLSAKLEWHTVCSIVGVTACNVNRQCVVIKLVSLGVENYIDD